MIHVYAFVEGLEAMPDGCELLHAAGLDAVVGRDGEPIEPLDHGLVVESLAASAVLPVRFGERFESETSFRAAVTARADTLRAALEDVRGCAEIDVRVAANGEPISGTDYLRARLAESTELDALAARLRPYTRAATDPSRGEVAFLVRRTDMDRVLDAVREFAHEQPALAVSCSGPWAPYSFTGAAA